MTQVRVEKYGVWVTCLEETLVDYFEIDSPERYWQAAVDSLLLEISKLEANVDKTANWRARRKYEQVIDNTYKILWALNEQRDERMLNANLTAAMAFCTRCGNETSRDDFNARLGHCSECWAKWQSTSPDRTKEKIA